MSMGRKMQQCVVCEEDLDGRDGLTSLFRPEGGAHVECLWVFHKVLND